mmetsp:Transcript_10535/g.28012  ORF Transcript_10535/g.28012 Transcript_10535/m.28012 type:complete len:87 (-) Transcript_10535:108-368(-)
MRRRSRSAELWIDSYEMFEWAVALETSTMSFTTCFALAAPFRMTCIGRRLTSERLIVRRRAYRANDMTAPQASMHRVHVWVSRANK